MEKFAEMVSKNNPEETKEQVMDLIKLVLKDVKAGKKCSCGNPIWVAGGAFIGNSCFTCITGEADGSEDYEIEEALLLQEQHIS